MREQLRSQNGGPLSVVSVREVVYGATDEEALQDQWQALLDPVKPESPGLWAVGDGPAVRVIQSAENGIQRIVINVASLAQARQFLAERGLLGAVTPREVTLAGSELDGVSIVLVEDGA